MVGEISYDSSILLLSTIILYCSILLLENIIAYKNKEKVLENAQIRVENRKRLWAYMETWEFGKVKFFRGPTLKFDQVVDIFKFMSGSNRIKQNYTG